MILDKFLSADHHATKSLPMQLAIQGRLTDCLTRQRSGIIELASELGIRALELSNDEVLDHNHVREIQTRLDAHGVRLVSTYAYCWNTERDGSFPQAALDQAHRSLDRAQLLGAEMIVLLNPPPKIGASVQEMRQSFARCADLLVPEIQRRGLQVNFNNSGASAAYFGQALYLKQMCEQYAPQARLTFDVGNWMLAGESVHEAIDLLAPWISMVHVKDWTIQASSGSVRSKARGRIQSVARTILNSPLQGLFRSVGRAFGLKRRLQPGTLGVDGTWYIGAIAGQGVLDQRAILTHLHRVGFNGHLCIEYEGLQDQTASLRQSALFVKSILAEVLNEPPPRVPFPEPPSRSVAAPQVPGQTNDS